MAVPTMIPTIAKHTIIGIHEESLSAAAVTTETVAREK
jgi:hypothetical protein